MLRITRLTVVNYCLVAFAAALAIKSFWVQLIEGDRWSRLAENQHYTGSVLPARRGAILDATGMMLAESQQLISLSVAPREVRDRRKLERALLKVGVPRDVARLATDRRRRWVQIPRRFNPSEVAALTKMTGVYTNVATQRVTIQSDGIRRLVGRTRDSLGVEGLELLLDSLLRGTTGQTRVKRAPRGVRIDADEPARQVARDGHSVTLTINHALQDIADRALLDAVSQRRATGGDVVVLNPRNGDILAMSSVRRDARSTIASAVTEPYEPGSTLKPFIAGALLERRLARADELVATHDGEFTAHGRTIHDEHKAAAMSLVDVIRFSSNIGIAQLSERLTSAALYALLRDLGFGTPTGITYPSEAGGVLREPRLWTDMSHMSHAMGYELSVTPLQLALAYASIANGGELLEPRLVREIRDADGDVVYRARPRAVRRVMTRATAEQLRDILKSVVDSGTAIDADLATFDLGGKTGTARRTVSGRYAQGQYTASFVGLFPARAPQLVVVVKIDNPGTTIFGGRAAAPVAKAILQGAIASREAPLDAIGLAAERLAHIPRIPNESFRVVEQTSSPANGMSGDAPTRTESVDLATLTARDSVDRGRVAVPELNGESLRAAVRLLHSAGFRVQIVNGRGGRAATSPPAGSLLPRGSLVMVRHR
ncbi:MAG: penicillin-binding transpeptidase domain-containing protein [Gemmatimonadaceae bacterium]